MNQNKKRIMRRIAAAALLCLLMAGLFAGCADKQAPEATTAAESEETAKPGSLGVTRIFAYSGPYVEDGSDEEVQNIAAAVLVNTTATDYEYVEFSVTTDTGTYAFAASTVKAGSTTTVLCRDKNEIKANEKMKSFQIDAAAEYLIPVSLAEGVIEIYYTGGTVTLKNASAKDLTDVRVFYKQRDDNGYLGGITYESVTPSLKAGEFTQLNSVHLDEVVNIRYGE